MGLLYGKVTENGYIPSLWHKIFTPGVTGNSLNGLGEAQIRRPTAIYHRQDYWHPWRMVQDMFYMRSIFSGKLFPLFKSFRLDWKKPTAITNKQIKKSPEEWSKRIKDYAISLGIDKVGITVIKPEWIFERDEMKERYVIVLVSAKSCKFIIIRIYGHVSWQIGYVDRAGQHVVLEAQWVRH